MPAGTYLLSSQLPNITSTVTVDGGSANPTIDGGNAVRPFFVASGAKLSLNELTLTKGNTASNDGGAIRNQGTLEVSNSTLSGNTSANRGGAIFNSGTLTVSDSTFSGNSANGDGGGIFNQNILEVNSSTFSGNSASRGGGGIFNFAGALEVNNSTLSGNAAFGTDPIAGGGGGIGAFGFGATLKNTIVANSTSGGDCLVGAVSDGGYNLVEDGSCLTQPTSLSGDPLLGDLADNGGPTQTMALQDGSPAIDAIPNSTSGCAIDITQDQRGVSRPQGSACDIGAFELDTTAPSVTINQASGQAESTSTSPIHFTAVFDEPVSGFDGSDVALSGTAGATTAHVTEIAPNDRTTYDVAVSGMSFDGTVIASIPANAAEDFALYGNTASTSTDNTVTFIANSPPTAVEDSYTTNEDTAVLVDVLANDSDVDGDMLSITDVSDPAHGTAVVDNGKINYTPAEDYNGTDSFGYVVSDGNGGFAKATVTIDVKAVNDKPVAINDSATVNEGGTVTNGNVLINDTDVDGDALEAVLVSGPANGTLKLNADGTFNYTHNGSETTSDSFTYQASDGSLDSNVATVSINVSAVNDAPTVTVAAGGSCGTNDRSGRINLTVNDPDTPAEDLDLKAFSSNQTLVPNANLTFGGTSASRTLTALSGKTGTADITVTVSDGEATGTPLALTLKAGGNSNDTLAGTGATDILLGQNGDDTLRGMGGKDLLCGARGNDRLSGGADADRFEGGSGTDRATDFTPSQGDTKDNSTEAT